MKRLIAMFSLAICLWSQRDAKTLLQSAIKKETVDGNLAGAIEDYKKAASGARTDRATAARALFGLAQCYRRQGDSQAKSALERVVREYGDQPVAAQARTQLAALSETESKTGGTRLRKLSESSEYGCSSVSADGKWLGCAIGWVTEAAVVEVATGKARVLTALRKETPANRHINTFAISPDGKWMALHIYRSGGVLSELAVVPTDGSGVLKTIYKHPEGNWVDVGTWTPDSKEILFSVYGRGAKSTTNVMTVSVSTGAVKPVRQMDGSLQWVLMAYSSDGKWVAARTQNAQPSTARVEIWNASGETSDILKAPGASVLGWTPDGGSLVVTSRNDGSTSLLQFPIQNGKVSGPARVIPAGVESFSRPMGFDSHGSVYFYGGRSESDLYGAPFDPQSGVLTGSESPLSSRAVHRQGFGSWAPDGKKFASWTFDGFNNIAIGKAQVIVRNLPSGPETIATPERPFFPVRVPSWDSNSQSLLMLTRESEDDTTYRLQRLDPTTGKLSPVSVPVSVKNVGYTPSWTADARYLFYSTNWEVRRIDAQTGEEKFVARHPQEENFRGLVVNRDGTRLAYFGATRVLKAGGEWTTTSKRWIHVLNVADGQGTRIDLTNPNAGSESPLAWTPDGRFLVYATREENQPDLWIVPADGSAKPRPLSGNLPGQLAHLGFSPDGKTLSFTRTVRHEEIWMMSNFLGSEQ